MCRLLAWVSPEPRSVPEAVGEQTFEQFVGLARVHRDGWGVAWDPSVAPGRDGNSPGSGPAVVRAATCAAEDSRFSEQCRRLRSSAGIAHLRLASPGMAVIPENSHPFCRHHLAMAHNGGIYPLERVREILAPPWEARAAGTTDSERYMLAVAAAHEGSGAPIAEVLSDVIAELFAHWSPSSLNAVVLTPESVVVASAFNPHAPVVVMPQPADQYYGLRYRAGPQGVVVASSGVDQPMSEGWRPLDNMTLLQINRADAELSIHRLPVRPPSAWVASGTAPNLLR